MEKKKARRYFDDKPDRESKSVSSPSMKAKSPQVSKDGNDGEMKILTVDVDMEKVRYHKPFGHRKKTPEVSKFPGRAPISKEKLEKHSRGPGLQGHGVVHPKHLSKLLKKEENIKYANEQAARLELLLPENAGFLEAEPGETTTQFTQKQIVESVDIAAASKHFELKLEQFGPYRMKYSRNGRHLLLGGKMGHVAAFDWITKRLHCEINVMETVHDVCWLHIETMFAVAQKDWVYMYDNKGTELHCVKTLNKVLRMEYLPYHFLLANGSETGYLHWLDISIGELAGQYRTNLGKISIMKQNPYNAVLCVGQAKGVVSMWSPKVKTPLASILCHNAPLSALAIDPRGMYMATAGVNRNVRIWDIRKLEGPLQDYFLPSSPTQLEFSQNNLLAMGMGNVVQVYRDCCTKRAQRPYLQHKMNSFVENMAFCPYEDILGVGTNQSFVSLIVPGSGEANFDALESNPYQSKSQRREAEVKSLLEKIQPELISLDPNTVAEIDVPTLKEKIEARAKVMHLKPVKVDYKPRRKTRNKGTAKVSRNKKIVQEGAKREFVKKMNEVKASQKSLDPQKKKSFGVLDRFVKK